MQYYDNLLISCDLSHQSVVHNWDFCGKKNRNTFLTANLCERVLILHLHGHNNIGNITNNNIDYIYTPRHSSHIWKIESTFCCIIIIIYNTINICYINNNIVIWYSLSIRTVEPKVGDSDKTILKVSCLKT